MLIANIFHTSGEWILTVQRIASKYSKRGDCILIYRIFNQFTIEMMLRSVFQTARGSILQPLIRADTCLAQQTRVNTIEKN